MGKDVIFEETVESLSPLFVNYGLGSNYLNNQTASNSSKTQINKR